MNNPSEIAISTPKMGIKGEFQVIIKNADTGEVRFDSGFQDNLITDWGIERYGGYHHYSEEGLGSSYQNYNGKTANFWQGYTFSGYCHVGTGNKAPENQDGWLQNAIASVYGSLSNSGSIYLPDTKEQAYYSTYFYRFNRTINNQNIAEIGLSPYEHTTQRSWKGVFTRALIKNQLGEPTVLSVKSNEVLEVYYRLWVVVSTEKTTSSMQVTHTSSSGEQTQKNVSVDTYISSYNKNIYDIGLSIPKRHSGSQDYAYFYITDGDYSRTEGNIQSNPVQCSQTKYGVNGQGQYQHASYIRVQEDCYVPGSKKQVGRVFLDHGHKITNHAHNSVSSPNIREIAVPCVVGSFIFIFNDNGTDKGIPKTNNDTLEFVFETSWDRYTGDTSKLVV